jgi:hypothetical protein
MMMRRRNWMRQMFDECSLVVPVVGEKMCVKSEKNKIPRSGLGDIGWTF